MNEIVNMISTIGFPIVCTLGLAWYVREINTSFQNKLSEITAEHRSEISEMRKSYSEDIARISDALDRNTEIMGRLLNDGEIVRSGN